MKDNKWKLIILGGTLVLVVAAGLFLIGKTTAVSAAVGNWLPSKQIASTIITEVGYSVGSDVEGFNHRGSRGPGMPGRAMPGGPMVDELLAQELGISTDELQAAHEKATQAALDQALADELITQEQYDMMILRGFGFHGMRINGNIDYNALLAEALGISVDELRAAQERARQAAIDQMIEDGKLTEEQAAMVKAHEALKDYIDPEALMAEAFGLSVEELQAAREEGKTLTELLNEQGLTAVEVRDAYQATYEQAIQRAVDDGVITADQAEQFLNRPFMMDGFRSPRFMTPRGDFRDCPGAFPGKGGFGIHQYPTTTESNNDL